MCRRKEREIGDSLSVRTDQDRGIGEFVEKLSNDGFYFRGKDELNT